MYSSILRSASALGAALTICLVLPGCGDDTPETNTEIRPITMFTPPPVLEDGQDGEGDGGGQPTLDDRWGSCSTSSQCLLNEQCIRGITESFNVCLGPCESVDDCTDPSIPARLNFTAFMTCTEFLGAKRCILGCQTTAQCIAGMTCTTNACVWKQ